MNYIEKVKHLIERANKKDYDRDKYYLDIVAIEKPFWKDNELEALIKGYDYLPHSYIQFIKEFDNLGLSFVTFYGSKLGRIIPLEEELEYWEQLLKGDHFPFAKDPEGGVFTIDRNQRIIFFDRYDFDCERPIKIADSFAEFVEECLMGKRYHEFEYIENNQYYDFLKSLGWV